MKALRRIVFLLTFIFSFSITAQAEDIYSINTDVLLDNEGTAHIKQTWKTNATEGTEYYIPMNNMGPMELYDYKVSSPESEFQQVEWDVDKSFEEKAYTYGVNYTNKGLELCFGKSEYGDMTYVIEYKLKNAVQSFTDADGFNIRFVNDQLSPASRNVSTTIHIDGVELNDQNSRIWGFGYNGDVIYEDGIIKATSSNFNSNSHMTLLMRLNKGILNPTYQASGDFETLRERAFEGSSYTDDFNSDEYNGKTRSFGRIIGNLFGNLIFLIPLLGIFAGGLSKSRSKKAKPRNLSDYKIDKTSYARDIPAGGHLPTIYNFYKYNANAKYNDLMSAYLLLWLNKGYINVEEVDKKGVFFNNKEVEVVFTGVEPELKDNSERKLWAFLRAAAVDNVLEEKELKAYVQRHTSAFAGLEEIAWQDGNNFALKNNLLVEQKSFLDNRPELTPKGGKVYQDIFGFKKYLKDFTIINEREVKEVSLWDSYLIIAAIFGIADQVSEQFEDLYPQYTFYENEYGSPMNTYLYISYLNSLSRNTYSAYQSNVSASSGGGGSSSFGGGGGSFGGGSGGGSR